MKYGWIIVALVVLSVEANALDFRGIKIDGGIDEAEKIANTITRSEIVHADKNFMFATLIKDIPVRVIVKQDDNIVKSIEFRFSRKDYSTIKDAMVEKYGSDFRLDYETYKNGFGASFDFEQVFWVMKSSSLLLNEKSKLDDLESYAIMISTKFIKKYSKTNKDKPGF